jgi:hypothetical protein
LLFTWWAERNLSHRGIATSVSGHIRRKFDRYNILSDHDLRVAAQRQAEYLESQKGTISSTVHEISASDKKQAVKHNV